MSLPTEIIYVIKGRTTWYYTFEEALEAGKEIFEDTEGTFVILECKATALVSAARTIEFQVQR